MDSTFVLLNLFVLFSREFGNRVRIKRGYANEIEFKNWHLCKVSR